ncbi:MAG: C40 family peptidase [Bacteroidetes bacterium]|nr:C40 family peptidase [Bacteroidota bacterium]MDA1268635.1 C40 family peptidase [Bacteroidota bacterium]
MYSPSTTSFFLCFIALFVLGSCGSKRRVANSSPEFTIIETAKSYRGTPYRYGGTTRAGIDCSALVYHSFASVGVKLPRTSTDQSKMGKKIPEHKITPGDVLFFATGKKKKEVTHTGIVTEGRKNEVRFIHASTSLGVTEDYLRNSYWTKAFLFAKRLRSK